MTKEYQIPDLVVPIDELAETIKQQANIRAKIAGGIVLAREDLNGPEVMIITANRTPGMEITKFFSKIMDRKPSTFSPPQKDFPQISFQRLPKSLRYTRRKK